MAVYSELDHDALHVTRADEAYNLGPGPAAENYLERREDPRRGRPLGGAGDPPRVRLPGRERGLRPGAASDAGVVFIGPPAQRDRGDGLEDAGARADAGGGRADRARAPPSRSRRRGGAADRLASRSASRSRSRRPAAAAARASGWRSPRTSSPGAFEGSSREGEKFFSDPTVYLERYLPDPRHVEVQVLADTPRQRDPPRRARLLDPAPPPEADRGVAGAGVDRRRGDARAHRRRSASTRPAPSTTSARARSRGCSWPAPERRKGSGEAEYFFLEMNTRVQVEHCVTEMTTGIDIVKEGIRAAAGEPLSYSQEDVVLRGHAIECRINAEDASKNFAPAPGSDRPLPRARGPGRAGRLGRRRRRRGLADVRPDGRQADRLGRRPRAGHQAHAAGPRRIRDRGAEDADPVPQGAAGERAVGARGDLQGPDRGQHVAEAARLPRARGAGRRGGEDGASRSSRTTTSRSPAGASTCASWAPRRRPAQLGAALDGSAARSNGRRAGARRAPKRGAGVLVLGRRARHAALAAAGERVEGARQAGRRRSRRASCSAIIEAMKMENEITAHKSGTVVELPISEGAADPGRRPDRDDQERRGLAAVVG